MTRLLPRWFVEHVNPVADEDDLPVSTLELFFDLIFVFTVAQFTAVIAYDPLIGLIQSVLMFGFLWWMYAGYSWLTNVIPPERPARRILLLCAMAGWLVVALTVPAAFASGSVWIAVGMLVVVLVHGLMYLQAARSFGPVFIANLAAVAAVFAAELGPEGAWRYSLWALAAVIVWSVPFWHGQRGLNLHPAHITERHGLVVIVALGESVVAIGIGARDLPVDADLLLAAVLGLAIGACMWWSLFVRDLPATEHRLTATTDAVKRVRKVLAGLSYAFIPVLLGILVFAAGLKHAVGHALSPLDVESTWLLSGGVAAFLVGTAGLRLAMPLPRPWERVALAAVVLALAPIGLVNTALQLGAITAVLVAALAWEGRAAAAPATRGSSPVRSG
ncbi:Low temperature requirement protein LtrA [Glycomyces sambucus]|uniref:Low temperature requirement protein LtrA n=1 Tax=Glycomyces sambucus TaxID=380244 RepID=A0A1G9D3B0_9ACTN|nr:low temperature requirement protein A [Glycomyces sambucus]SDK58313.1 Low temperature requirement protein LtrA [Glycomyces sambucus]